MNTLRSWFLVLGLCWGVWAGAQESQPITQEEAARRYEEADQRYELREFEKALELFGALYQATEEPALLFNIAQCHRQMGHLEEAKEGYQRFLQEVPKEHPARPKAERWLKEIEAELQKKKDDEAHQAATQEATSQKANTQPNPTKPFVLAAVTAGAISASLGYSALSLARKPPPDDPTNPDQVNEFIQQKKTATRLALASDAALCAAIISAGIYLWRHRQEQKKETPTTQPKTPTAASAP